MRQVPGKTAVMTVPHLLIGSGRVAKHFARFFTLAGIPFSRWDTPRVFDGRLAELASKADRVWILVSDSAIASVAEQVRILLRDYPVVIGPRKPNEPQFLHASGATVIEGVRGVHPLMTFGPDLYDLATYSRVPFVIEDLADGLASEEVLGSLPNPSSFLGPEKRPLYHALVSVAGNFPAMIWADVFERFERELGLSRDLLVPFLFRTLLNVIASGDRALTGPLIRGDHATVRKHHEALHDTSLSTLYTAFETFIRQEEHL